LTQFRIDYKEATPMLNALRRGVNRVAASVGYVPAKRVTELESELTRLKEQTASLTVQVNQQETLEQQGKALHEMQKAHANAKRGIQQAVADMEEITARLATLIQVTWPEQSDPVPTTGDSEEGTKEPTVV
jgi:methyl-accepting chemotaxis protein